MQREVSVEFSFDYCERQAWANKTGFDYTACVAGLAAQRNRTWYNLGDIDLGGVGRGWDGGWWGGVGVLGAELERLWRRLQLATDLHWVIAKGCISVSECLCGSPCHKVHRMQTLGLFRRPWRSATLKRWTSTCA